ncbi:serine/threonine-protein phosphatase 6 regulatory ankyrin repeat subunit B-like [Physella acuta]|uniref:serine/threonine-protein phosphatase 6 regulatory ankyrin repeat subunit B-like n=1 Tax=Physella acuta TaxID=109671 RepID=UPI0027DE4360|nr:serine/threonine-protein phosphatase 6 regulatory ankyrin repeat subunit B-like [Physella acuta]
MTGRIVKDVFNKAKSGEILRLENSDINLQNMHGVSALMMSVMENDILALKTLISAGADVNLTKTKLELVDVKNSERQTPLHVAANKSDTEMINLLVEAKADINCVDKRGQTPLAICVENSDMKTAKCLLRHGAEVNKGNNHGATPLIWAVTKQHEKFVDILILHKADVNYKQTTALIYAVLNVNKNIVSKLVQAGADVNMKTARCYRERYRIQYDLLEEVKNTLLDTSEHNLTPLHIVAQTFPRYEEKKSVEVVNVLLKGGANVHAVDEDDRTPLHIASIFGDLDIVKSLIKAGSNINAVDKFGNTPLFFSLLYNHRELAKYLIKSGADVNLMSESQRSPLYVAVFYKNTELVRMLIKHRVLPDKGRKSELLKALEYNDVIVSILLVKNGANVNVKDDTQTPALIKVLKLVKFSKTLRSRYIGFQRSEQYLFTLGRKRVYGPDPDEPSVPTKVFVSNKQSIKTKALIESMLQHGANVSLADVEGNTCLHEAARYCSKEILELLLHYKAEVNQQNVNGETPLMIACVSGNVEAAEILLKAGANVFLVDKNKNTALHHCVQYGIDLFPLVEKLVLHSNQHNNEFRQENTLVSNVNRTVNAQENNLFDTLQTTETNSTSEIFVKMTNDNKESAIHKFCTLGRLNVVKFLISQKCNLDCTTSSGQTPLIIASKHQLLNVVKCLIENKASVNIQDNEGESALHAAVKCGNLEIVSFLVENGANVNEPNNAGQTPLFYAGTLKIIKYLTEKGAEINRIDKSGETALHFKSKSYNPSAVDALLELGANPDITTDEGITALMIAASVGYISVLESLIGKGANVHVRDSEGRNACMYAVIGVKNKKDSYVAEYGDTYNDCYGDYNIEISSESTVADGLFEIINFLVTAGADLNIMDNENRSLIVYTLLNVKKESQKECIQKFLKLGVNPILHKNHRYLLNEFILPDGWPYFEEKCVRTVLNDDSKIIFQFLLINGITLCHSVSNYTQFTESNFTYAARNKNFDFLRFFLATGHIYKSDLKSLRNDKYFKDDADDNLDTNDSLHAELTLAKREPWPLVKLAFIEVSTLLGTGPMREEKLQQTKLPPRLQRTLMFQEPISRLPVEDWSKIPLCFDPVQYETLPCPRPLLYYWPVGHRLVR